MLQMRILLLIRGELNVLLPQNHPLRMLLKVPLITRPDRPLLPRLRLTLVLVAKRSLCALLVLVLVESPVQRVFLAFAAPNTSVVCVTHLSLN